MLQPVLCYLFISYNFASLQYALPMACNVIRSTVLFFFFFFLSLVNLMTLALGQWTCYKREQVCLLSMVYFMHVNYMTKNYVGASCPIFRSSIWCINIFSCIDKIQYKRPKLEISFFIL